MRDGEGHFKRPALLLFLEAFDGKCTGNPPAGWTLNMCQAQVYLSATKWVCATEINTHGALLSWAPALPETNALALCPLILYPFIRSSTDLGDDPRYLN